VDRADCVAIRAASSKGVKKLHFLLRISSAATNRSVEISRDRSASRQRNSIDDACVFVTNTRTLSRRNDANIYSRGNFLLPECLFFVVISSVQAVQTAYQPGISDYLRRISSDVNVG